MNILTVTSLLLLSQWVLPQTTYCPSASDLEPGWGSSGVTITNQGWTIVGTNGGGAAATKASYNLLGGWVSYTINLASVNYYVNANLYAIFPSNLGSAGFPSGTSSSAAPYCDGQGGSSYPWCPEIDFTESNGHCAAASTIHTVQGTSSGNCDSGGCAINYDLSSSSLNMNITFSTTGAITFYVNGVAKSTYSTTTPGSAANTVVTNYMNAQGAVLYSSMWQGWSPVTSTCTTASSPWGSLSTSSFSISNLKLYGKIVQGPTPTVCSGSATTAAPATTKAATTTAPATTKAATTTAPATTKAATTTAPATTKAATTTSKPATTTTKPTSTTVAPTSAPTAGAPKTYDAQALGSWTDGRSTYYGVGNGGNCGYGTLPTSTFDWGLIAAANTAYYNNAEACGQCFEIYCVSTWAATSSTPNYCINGKSVVVQVSDQCPGGGWCSGDIVHFDLSTSAFSKIVTPAQIGTVGVIATKYRRTACPASGNIKITAPSGNSQWYLAYYFTNVADYGGLTAVSVICGSSTYTMTRQTYNAWVYSGSISQASTTCQIKITDTKGQSLTSKTGVITAWTATSIDFGANFANPAGTIYTSSETVAEPNKAPVIAITVVVVGVVALLLIIALIWTLRSKKRRESVAYRSDSVAAPNSAPTETNTSTELVVAPSTAALDASADKPRDNFEDTRQQLAQAVEVATQQQSDWDQRTDENGHNYFYNNKTGVTQWENPDDVQTTA